MIHQVLSLITIQLPLQSIHHCHMYRSTYQRVHNLHNLTRHSEGGPGILYELDARPVICGISLHVPSAAFPTASTFMFR